MGCYSPLEAWQTDEGKIVFVERGSIRRFLELPCGQCIGCRLERCRQWAVRCVHEAQMHEFNSFVTLTYDEDHCPSDFSLNYRHFQLFMKRLRKKKGAVRFYMCGEYGDLNSRPHFHACLFNCFFPDREICRESEGIRLYTSAVLTELWPYGFSSVGDVTFESAAYVARYVVKKVTGERAASHYEVVEEETGEIYQRVPEFTRMSLKPGIGATWFEKYGEEVFPLDRVVIAGRVQKPPRFYDKLLALMPGYAIDEVAFARYERAMRIPRSESEPDRLAVRARVAKARLKSRSL